MPSLARVIAFGLVALALAAAGVGLGDWQLDRAHAKNELSAARARQGLLPELDGISLLNPAIGGVQDRPDPAQTDALVHRRVVLTGRWLPERTVYLDNRTMQDRSGFLVVTPLELALTIAPSAQPQPSPQPERVVLVQRGWVPRNFEDRSRLQPVATPPGLVEIRGTIEASLSRTFALAGTPPEEGSSPIRQNLNREAFSAETGLDVLALVVVQTGPSSEGLQRHWAAADSGVQRHYGYAFQWFALAFLSVFLYMRLAFIPYLRRIRSLPVSH